MTVFLTTIIYVPCCLLVSIVLSFLFTKKETCASVLVALLFTLFTSPFFIINLTKTTNVKASNLLHIVFCFIDPIYGFIATYDRISEAFTFQQAKDILNKKKTRDVPFELYFEFENFCIPLSLIFVKCF